MSHFLRNSNGPDQEVIVVSRSTAGQYGVPASLGDFVTVRPVDADEPRVTVRADLVYEVDADTAEDRTPNPTTREVIFRQGLEAVINAFLDSTLNEAQALRAMHAAAVVALKTGGER